ncbi:Histidine--tRNA ligase [bioreactor metagenome]|uniref:histidine--tRNA ligase n=1 Tax=bioreactor metagenome TaxID=1076179 RepID=A0A645AUB2_9ZZZZ
MSIKKPRGTRDILPAESERWQFVDDIVRNLCQKFGYGEIILPTFEYTELFSRGVGDTTDVVQKEMYTFSDRDNRSLTLRPEGTASVMRAFLENGLHGGLLPAKFYYLMSCFRYEKPQAGRLREFHQFGAELLGTKSPAADAEVISLVSEFFSRLRLKNIALNINSLGCPDCRKEYSKALFSYFDERKDQLCDTCRERLVKNPMRIIDCKSETCARIAKDAPLILDFICDECRDHFEKVQEYLAAMGIAYTIDPMIVRGLDYYTKTVFEFVSNEIGAQSTVCGGGRYDGLAGQIGDVSMPGLGFALGLERLMMLMEAQGIEIAGQSRCLIYIAPLSEREASLAMKVTAGLRRALIPAETDLSGKSLKAQMKYADKLGVKYVGVIGEDEAARNVLNLKEMESGERCEITLDDLASHIKAKENLNV